MRTLVLVGALVGCGVLGGYLLGAVREPELPAPGKVKAPVMEQPMAMAAPAAPVIVVEDEARARPVAVRDTRPYDDGMGLVSRAIAQHAWTASDAVALGSGLARMEPDERARVLRVLVPAFNRGEVVATYRGPLVQ